jgi:hypothetical protein
MTLNDWKSLENIQSLPELAERLQVANRINPAKLVHNWLTGKAIPNRENMKLIKQATDGKVTANDFFTQ